MSLPCLENAFPMKLPLTGISCEHSQRSPTLGRPPFEIRGHNKPRLCLLPRKGCFDENGETDESAFYPLKQGLCSSYPVKTAKMTKVAGVTRAKAWSTFRAPPPNRKPLGVPSFSVLSLTCNTSQRKHRKYKFLHIIFRNMEYLLEINTEHITREGAR